MGRTSHYHMTPESGRMCVNLKKRQLKEIKKIAVEFEISEKEVFKLAIELLIKTYQSLPEDIIEHEGIKALGLKKKEKKESNPEKKGNEV